MKLSLSTPAAILALVVPAIVLAAPPGASTGPAASIPQGPVVPAIPGCDAVLDATIADINKPQTQPQVTTMATIIANDTAYAEGRPAGTGFQPSAGGKASPSGGRLVGSSSVGAVPSSTLSPLTYEISKGTSGKAILKWTFQGKQHQSNVDTCSSRIWTAADGSSTVSIKLSNTQAVPR